MADPLALSPSSASLARDRLGVPSVVFFILSAVAPLTVIGGVVTTAYAVTGLTDIPAAFIAVALILAIFSAGYVAMARRIVNAGAFYSFISRGIGRPVGVAAAMVAVLAYNGLQFGLYGAFGPQAAAYFGDKFGWDLSWWVYALAAWAVTAVLGVLAVDLNGRVLAVLLTAELVIIVVLTISGLADPAGGVSFATLSPEDLFTSGVGAALVIGILGFVGFEQSAVFSEEAKDARRTVPTATYLSLAVIGVVYAAASWAMAVHYGDDQVVATAQEQGPGTLFGMGGQTSGEIAQVLFLTSLFAAMISFHNAVARYMFALGRERVLPGGMGRTYARTGSPIVASVVQSVFGLAVIILYAVAGWDPFVRLFFWIGTTGGFGVLLLLAATSASVVGFFARDAQGENVWRRLIAPAIAFVALVAIASKAVDDYATLLGVAPGSTESWLLPTMYGVAAVIGLCWALVLRATRPQVYAAIGLGANAATGHTTPLLPPDQTGGAAEAGVDRQQPVG
ncbi:MAG: APC family permease [Micromonosporaceae bacterium]|jgi:amino acid transporter|nr:APC family permease [Micromonosporaceae bacterium]